MNLLSPFLATAQAAESGGNPNAKNPFSSASGLYGFTDGTWGRVVQKYGDRYGLTVAGKNDPRQQELGARAIAEGDYMPWWAGKGISDPNPVQLYQTHFWGTPNLDKVISAPKGTSLKDALGPSFDAVFKGNAKLFGNNPNITTDQAYDVVSGYAEHADVPVASKAYPPGSEPVDQPPPQQPGGPMADFIPPAMLPQAPTGSPPGMFSPMNLLRMGGAALSGRNLGDSFGKMGTAAAEGAMADQANYRANAQLDNQTQKTRADVIGEASKLMEMGMNPQVAIGLVTGRIDPAQAQQHLATFTSSGGKGMKGDTYLTPDGQSIVEMQHPWGPPSLHNLQTGQKVDALPQGSYRAQDAYYRTLHTGEAAAENGAMSAAAGAPKTIADLDALENLIPQIATGGDVLAVVRRNFTNLTGLPLSGNDQAAQNVAEKLFETLKVGRQNLLHGFGRVDLPMVKAVQAAGAGWQQNPEALRAIIAYSKIEPQRQAEMIKDWRKATPAQRGQGFRAFSTQWDEAHPMEDTIRQAFAPITDRGPNGPRKSLNDIFGK